MQQRMLPEAYRPPDGSAKSGAPSGPGAAEGAAQGRREFAAEGRRECAAPASAPAIPQRNRDPASLTQG